MDAFLMNDWDERPERKLTDEEREILQAVADHVVMEWKGEMVFGEQRFMIDPVDGGQVIDRVTLETHHSPALVELLRAHETRTGPYSRRNDRRGA